MTEKHSAFCSKCINYNILECFLVWGYTCVFKCMSVIDHACSNRHTICPLLEREIRGADGKELAFFFELSLYSSYIGLIEKERGERGLGKRDLKRQGSLHDKENLEFLITSKLLLYSDNAQQRLEVMIKHLQNNLACHYEWISYRAEQYFECLRDLIQPCRGFICESSLLPTGRQALPLWFN